ncbi:hypothetical protein MLD38_004384 [Melastoma candidum]|uniref:Uncharacterized protein n=1 Tax=Melastoma candidum TaxID=119954 RepID=A0ACB9S721_9MYRT|nr:hypothetical protein MLD38_004384 [Melastoma candidum]
MSSDKGLEDQGECSRGIHGLQPSSAAYHHQDDDWVGGDDVLGEEGFPLPDVNYQEQAMLPWSLPPILPPFSGNEHHPDNQFLIAQQPPLPPPLPPDMGLFNRRSAASSQFSYLDGGQQADQHFRLISDALGIAMPQAQLGPGGAFCLQAELGKMTAQEIMDAKALAASKSHSEAERRRRERINNHLAKLRSLLPSTTKTDKASLLAEVIQHVKELNRQTSLIAETSPIPTEMDELSVDASEDEGRFVIRASLCCEDRSDLLPDLIKALKALRMRTLKAEITTIGGRVRNVLFITGDEDPNHNNNYARDQQPYHYSVSSIQEALKAVIEKGGGGDESSAGNVKRQRVNTANIHEYRSL